MNVILKFPEFPEWHMKISIISKQLSLHINDMTKSLKYRPWNASACCKGLCCQHCKPRTLEWAPVILTNWRLNLYLTEIKRTSKRTPSSSVGLINIIYRLYILKKKKKRRLLLGSAACDSIYTETLRYSAIELYLTGRRLTVNLNDLCLSKQL